MKDLSEYMGGERSHLGWFMHHSATCRERRKGLHHELIDGPIPRRNHSDYSDRLTPYGCTVTLSMFELVVFQNRDRRLEV